MIESGVTFVEQTLKSPFVLSSGTIAELTEARAWVRVETTHGEFTGHGSIYLSDLWAWPDPSLSHEVQDAALRGRCQFIADGLPSLVGSAFAHPLALGLRLHDAVCDEPVKQGEYELPALAQAMCLSPFDAAIHDAVGQAFGLNAMHLYQGDPVATSADFLFDGVEGGAFQAIAELLVEPACESLSAWWLVGKTDDVEGDVRAAFDQHGYRCFKLKLHGRDVAEDTTRTIEVYRAAVSWGCSPELSVDTNEACADANFVLQYLERLQTEDAEAFAALQYLEQPTARDIVAHPYDWREVTALKPVLLDEGLTSLHLLPLTLEQGWSGLALKTCKGHSFALVAAAWAHRNGLMLAMQDLTNPGVSAIHSALFAAHTPTINGVELNSPQFTPLANAEQQGDWPGLFTVNQGKHHLQQVAPIGLGTTKR